MNKTIRLFLLIFMGLFGSPCGLKAQQEVLPAVDSFRTVVMNGLNCVEDIYVDDTLDFIKKGLYAFVNYDQTMNFDLLFLCFDPFYNAYSPLPKGIKPDKEFFTRSRDIRWMFLFYLEYFLLTPRPKGFNQQCKFSLYKIKDNKEADFYGETSSETVVSIYQTLILNATKKSFLEHVIRKKSQTLMENAGYRWVITCP
ncbi:MAG: hypothetical protein JNJ58_14445 [Chitinophagaceae bacterium]|nr:hypothetical protein [Chitinophagaceae bacterium]